MRCFSISLLFLSTGLLPVYGAQPAASITFSSPRDGDVALVIDNADGTRLRNVVAQTPIKKGKNTIQWDLKDAAGKIVPPGKYKWKGIISPRLMEITYQMTPYPNVEQHSPNSRPWEGRPQDGWLGNHNINRSVCAVNGRTYISQGGTEGGHSLAVLNSKGEKIWGRGRGTENMFKDRQGNLYTQSGTNIGRFDQKTNKETGLLNVASPKGGGLNAIAAWKGKMYVVYENGAARRMAVIDIKTKKRLKEVPIALKGSYSWNPTDRMAFNPRGELCAVSGNEIVRINLKTMKLTTVVKTGLKSALLVCFDEKGLMYVWDQGAHQVKVFSRTGKLMGTICRGGAYKAGPYDPTLVAAASSISVDNGFVWLVWPWESPRRKVKLRTNGTFVMDYFGNTYYGGGGVIDTTESSRNTYMYYRETAFKINLKKGTHKLTHILSTNQGDSQLYNPHHFRMDWVPLRVKGRKYFTNAPLLFRYFQALGAVYVYNERTKSVRFAAAFGQASRFGYLNNDAGKKYLQEKGKDINKQFFMWSDMNGNGKVDLTEVKFKERKADNRYGFIGRFDHELGAMGYNLRFEVDRFLRDGTPIYRERKMPFKAIYKFPSGI